MSQFCPVAADLNRHQSTLDDSEAKDDAIAAEAAWLMQPGQDYYPWTPEHVAEAMGEIAAGMGEDITRITDNLAGGKVSTAGATLNYAIAGYWRRRAIEAAETAVIRQWAERQQQDPDDHHDHERTH